MNWWTPVPITVNTLEDAVRGMRVEPLDLRTNSGAPVMDELLTDLTFGDIAKYMKQHKLKVKLVIEHD
jgi:hypothetical protein